MRPIKTEPRYRLLALSGGISLALLISGFWLSDGLGIHRITAQLLWPLTRL